MHHNPISIENLSYRYPDGIQALKGINLQIAATEKVAIIGANGSGKSTLLLHLNGILLPQQGEIVVGEMLVIPHNLSAIRNFVGLVFQNPDDQLFMPTIWEDIAFGLMNQGIRGNDLKMQVAEALVSVGLDVAKYRDRLSHNLSGGEKKRVAIAGVLAMQPQVLVFDEPSAQLDPRSRRQLIQLLQTRSETQLIATHDLNLVLELCDRTVVLSEGEIVYDGETKQVLSDREFLLAHSLEMPLSFN
ncbi:MAG: energy-coupling factor ABC transporter ATP-binding protein [Pseudanabaena sp. ELA748]